MKWVAVAIAALLAGVALLAAFGAWRWCASTRVLMERLEGARRPMPPLRFDAARDLEGLPPPVQRFFPAALADGTRHIAALSLEHRGTFNLASEQLVRPIRGVTRVRQPAARQGHRRTPFEFCSAPTWRVDRQRPR